MREALSSFSYPWNQVGLCNRPKYIDENWETMRDVWVDICAQRWDQSYQAKEEEACKEHQQERLEIFQLEVDLVCARVLAVLLFSTGEVGYFSLFL